MAFAARIIESPLQIEAEVPLVIETLGEDDRLRRKVSGKLSPLLFLTVNIAILCPDEPQVTIGFCTLLVVGEPFTILHE